MYKVELTSIEDTIINIMVVQQIDDQDQTLLFWHFILLRPYIKGINLTT